MLLDGVRRDARLTDASLSVTGRDVEASSVALKFDGGRWSIDPARGAEGADAQNAEMLANPVIKALLAWHEKEKPLDWIGGARDLKEQLTMYGLVGVSDTAIGIALARYRFALLDDYGLIVEKMMRKSRSRGWTVKDRTHNAQGFIEIPDEEWPEEPPF